MFNKVIPLVALTLISMGISGCSRTVEDVAKWETKGNVKKLVAALADPKEEVRLAAVEALGNLKNETTIDALAACFNDTEDPVRLAAVDALIAIGGDQITTPMIVALKLDIASARLKAATALGTLNATSAIVPLGEALDDVSQEVQAAAAKSIGQIGDEKGSIPLAGKLESDAPSRIRKLCAELLSETGGEVACRSLFNALGDNDEAIRAAANASLLKIGKPIKSQAMEALNNENKSVRGGALMLLSDIGAVPTQGPDLVWFKLAGASIDDSNDIDPELIDELSSLGDEVVPPLLEAAASKVLDIREHAGQALEQIGETCVPQAMNRVSIVANTSAREWFKSRSGWSGAPSWQIDLWGAIAALDPTFELEKTKVATLKAKGAGAVSLLSMPEFNVTRAYVPYVIQLLDDDTSWKAAKKALTDTGYKAILPLAAAIESGNDAIAIHAAEIAGIQPDERVHKSMATALQQRVTAGEELSNSPFYSALLKFDDPVDEPLLLKVRPNTDRAIRVFEKQFPDVRVKIADTSDARKSYESPITFLLTYAGRGTSGRFQVTFAKDANGDWRPNSALPDQLP